MFPVWRFPPYWYVQNVQAGMAESAMLVWLKHTYLHGGKSHTRVADIAILYTEITSESTSKISIQRIRTERERGCAQQRLRRIPSLPIRYAMVELQAQNRKVKI